ncbi:MAG: phosphate ABC transporter substrate-binding [Erysipelotrichaceae bacterium]|nr:MAG: phosphate ABC transporter substrate-binding [Erysipelotrichaceae bacterium]
MRKIMIVVLAFLLGGCSINQTRRYFIDPKYYLNVDGSTVTIPLAEAVRAAITRQTIEEVRPYVLHTKTHQAYVNLINKKVDLIFVTSPSAEELDLAKKAKVELEIIPIVSEAFVFLTNKDNPIDSLTIDQIQRIYTGEYTNWKQVGGNDMPIKAFQRPINSGSQTGFLELVMKNKIPMEAPIEMMPAGMDELIERVAVFDNTSDAIGYSYYYYVTDMWVNTNVKLIKVNGILPTSATIQDNSYPIHTAYYAVIRKDEMIGSQARRIIDFILSKEGQQLMEDAGYVKVK